jgi:hypothetical protein
LRSSETSASWSVGPSLRRPKLSIMIISRNYALEIGILEFLSTGITGRLYSTNYAATLHLFLRFVNLCYTSHQRQLGWISITFFCHTFRSSHSAGETIVIYCQMAFFFFDLLDLSGHSLYTIFKLDEIHPKKAVTKSNITSNPNASSSS